MGRRKVSLQLIPEEKSRKLTYERRKKSLLKKARELSALCGVDTCVIVYNSGSCSDGSTAQPEIWPPSHGEVRRVVERYQSERPRTRGKRSAGLQDFFENKKRKVESELEKVRKDAWDAKYDISDELLKSLPEDNLRDILSSLQRKLDVAKGRLSYMKEKAKGNVHPGDSTAAFPLPSLMMGDLIGYLPHSYGMQLPQQGPPLHLPGSNLGCCAESELARLEVGTGENWTVLNSGISEEKTGYPVKLAGSNLANVASGFAFVEDEERREDEMGEPWTFLDREWMLEQWS